MILLKNNFCLLTKITKSLFLMALEVQESENDDAMLNSS